MNKLFFILSFTLCLLSCKSRQAEQVDNTRYSTLPEIGMLTTDLPRYSVPPHHTKVTTTTDNITPPVQDPVTIPSTENEEGEREEITPALPDTDSQIQTLNTSAFSWEIGIRQTQIVDVRNLVEYKKGHIYDAVNISADDPSFSHQIQTLDKNNPVALYCQSGIRSLYAAKILQEMGFQIIYVLEGGLNRWIKDGKEIVK